MKHEALLAQQQERDRRAEQEAHAKRQRDELLNLMTPLMDQVHTLTEQASAAAASAKPKRAPAGHSGANKKQRVLSLGDADDEDDEPQPDVHDPVDLATVSDAHRSAVRALAAFECEELVQNKKKPRKWLCDWVDRNLPGLDANGLRQGASSQAAKNALISVVIDGLTDLKLEAGVGSRRGAGGRGGGAGRA